MGQRFTNQRNPKFKGRHNPMEMLQPLISPEALSELMAETATTSTPVVVIDTRDPSEYAIAHIPGAINIREIFTYLATSTTEGLASLQAEFAKLLGAAGIAGHEPIVIYEDAMNKGFGQSCRGYFLLRYLGCSQVSVLHGGYQAWLAARLPISADVPTPSTKLFEGKLDPTIMVTTAEMLTAVKDPRSNIVLLDVRDQDEWLGESSSPYGVDFCPRKGRIPGAVWIEWYQFMQPDTEIALFKSAAELSKLCAEVGITADTPVYIYCFKGSRASNALIALKAVGIKDVRNYFASWNEWSRDPSLPIETGLPAPQPAMAGSAKA
jgi:thiosulfate/3-mercaptopyruvate sulfurtransferase